MFIVMSTNVVYSICALVLSLIELIVYFDGCCVQIDSRHIILCRGQSNSVDGVHGGSCISCRFEAAVSRYVHTLRFLKMYFFTRSK